MFKGVRKDAKWGGRKGVRRRVRVMFGLAINRISHSFSKYTGNSRAKISDEIVLTVVLN